MCRQLVRLLYLVSILLITMTGCEGIHLSKTPTPPPPTAIDLLGDTVTNPVLSEGHPRLWIRQEDLPRIRALVADSNPYYKEGLSVLVEMAKQNMDAGNVPGEDAGTAGYEEYPTEEYALLFAFMSLVDPDSSKRDEYAARARTLLMFMMKQAVKGPAEGKPFRDISFSWNDRSRWNGHSFGLAVDWIYPYLTAGDKEIIRKVFLRWCEEIKTEGRFHPEPVGRINDPAMVSDLWQLRWSANNYFTGGMRNMGYMALALDPADDPQNELHNYLNDAIGARLYLLDNLLYTDAMGGISPEGLEYAPQALGYGAEFLLALYTAGVVDPDSWGNQVSSLAENPFWNATIPAYLHSLSPAKTILSAELDYMGEMYQPAWVGDGQNYWPPDMIQLFGPLGIYDQLTGNQERLEKLRWMQMYLPPGGLEALINKRIGDTYYFGSAIEYFLLFDPSASEPTDPRPGLPLDYFAEGTGRLFARTSWEPDASWFDYALGWITISHQLMEGNTFEFYRNGEWLTKRRVGYGDEYSASDNQNTLAIQNDKPDRPDDDYRTWLWERGSQWPYNDAVPKIINRIVTDRYVYVTGDATGLYNWIEENLTSVTQAVRSIAWLKASRGENDVIVVYDRAATARQDQFKRFWLGLPFEMNIQGQTGAMTTPSGQQLFVNALLPSDAELKVFPAKDEPTAGAPAQGDLVKYKLRIEPASEGAAVNFLTFLQGADSGASAYPVVFVESQLGNAYQGACVGTVVVLFAVNVNEGFEQLDYQVPAGVSWHMITGLQPGRGYDVSLDLVGDNEQVSIRPGTMYTADSGGVLWFESK